MFSVNDLCDVGAASTRVLLGSHLFVISAVSNRLTHHGCSVIIFACPSSPKLHQVLVQLQSNDKDQDFSLTPIQVSISVQLWRLPGCHEFQAALGET